MNGRGNDSPSVSCTLAVQERCGAGSFEAFAVLRAHAADLRDLLSMLTASEASVPVSTVQEALEERAAEWGASPGSFAALLHPERLFTGAVAVRENLDEAGELRLTRGEVLAALDPQLPLKRVCRSVQNQLVDVKALFFQLLSKSGSGQTLGDNSALAAAADMTCKTADSDSVGESELTRLTQDIKLETSAASLDKHAPDTGHASVDDDAAMLDSLDVAHTQNTSDGDGHVYISFDPLGEDAITLQLSVGTPTDPYAGLPVSPAHTGERVQLPRLHAALRGLVQDSAHGHGVLYADVADALSAARFAEYLDFAHGGVGKAALRRGVSWSEFVGTVLHCLRR